MTSFLKSMLGATLGVLLACASLQGTQLEIWEQFILAVVSLAWTLWGVAHGIHYLCGKDDD